MNRRNIAIIISFIAALCVFIYFHASRATLHRIVADQAERLSKLETNRNHFKGTIAGVDITPEMIRQQMAILKGTNQDCMVCHSGGVSCKTCHEDFEGIIKQHRRSVEEAHQ